MNSETTFGMKEVTRNNTSFMQDFPILNEPVRVFSDNRLNEEAQISPRELKEDKEIQICMNKMEGKEV